MGRPTVLLLLLLLAALLNLNAVECRRSKASGRCVAYVVILTSCPDKPAHRKERYYDDKSKESRLRDSTEDIDRSDNDDDNDDDNDNDNDDEDKAISRAAAVDDKFAGGRQPAHKRHRAGHNRGSGDFVTRWQYGLPAWLADLLDEKVSKDADSGEQRSSWGRGGANAGSSSALPDEGADASMSSSSSNRSGGHAFKAHWRIGWPKFLGLPPARHSSNPSRGNWYQGSNVCRSTTGQLPEEEEDSDSRASAFNTDTSRLRHDKRAKSVTCQITANTRKCQTTIIDSDGKRFERVKVERCCSGYSNKGNKCVAGAKADNLTDAMRKQGAATFASILTELAMEPAANTEATLFAPTDHALEQYFTSLGLNVTAVVLNAQHKNIAVTIKQLLQAHTLRRYEPMDVALDDQLFKTEHPHPNASLRVNLYEQVEGKPMVNCVPLVKSDITTKNGLLNIVDHVLLPVTKSLTSKLEADAQLTRFSAALKRAFGGDLSSLLPSSERPVTIFAPNNEAMDDFERLTNNSMGTSCLQRVLRQHFAASHICLGAIGHRTRVAYATGREILLERRKQTISVAGMSHIVEGDILATDGVIHIIDKVIHDNDNAIDFERKMTAGNLLGFLKLMERVGVNPKEISNVTILVPPTAALQNAASLESCQKLQVALSTDSGVNGEPAHTQIVERKSDIDEASLVNYHMVPGLLTCKAFRGGSTQTTLGVPLVLQTYGLFPFLGNVHTANCVRVVKKNTLTCNGIIHELEKVLEPPSKTVYQTIRSTAGLERFATLLEQTTYNRKLDVLADDTFTVYAPNNAAMRYVEATTEVEKETFVERHVARGYKCCAGVPEVFSTYVDMIGSHRIWLTKEMPSGSIAIKGSAQVAQCDLVSTNGVVHVIDQALGPRSRLLGAGRFALPVPLFPVSRGFEQP